MRFLISKKNTEEKIKEATFELLADKGYAQLNMRDIAKRAQTAVGQLTYYYGTKEHLIVTVIEEVINIFIHELEEYINNSTDKVEAITEFFDELFEKEYKVFKVLVDFTAQSIWNDTFKTKLKDFFSRTTELIYKAYKEKGMEESKIQEAADFFTAILYGMAVQKVIINTKESGNNVKNKILERERKLFNAKPANGLL